jgi:redox-sensitive bicupin YhaK (pirin superfamily)
MNVWDVRVGAGRGASLALPEGHSAAIAVLRGEVTANASAAARAAQLIVLSQTGEEIRVEAGAAGDATILVLSGEPIGEPIVGYGPFVMNSREEIETAMNDLRLGKFGRLPVASGPAPTAARA